MPKRLLSVTIISWLYILAGTVGLAYHAAELNPSSPRFTEALLVCFIRLIGAAERIGAVAVTFNK